MQYLIIVESQGNSIARHIVEADDALAAINQVEPLYGEPVKVEYVSVDLEDGRKRHMLVANNWHGYTFLARRLSYSDEKA